MISLFPTIILRHRKENKKKCSLRGLEKLPEFLFYSYPLKKLPPLDHYIMLSLEGPPLTLQDQDKGVFLLDATWKYAQKMEKFVGNNVAKRSLPSHIKTAYPRKQHDCIDPARGLSSIEALYVAYTILGRQCSFLLDNYHWKNDFLQQFLGAPKSELCTDKNWDC